MAEGWVRMGWGSRVLRCDSVSWAGIGKDKTDGDGVGTAAGVWGRRFDGAC